MMLRDRTTWPKADLVIVAGGIETFHSGRRERLPQGLVIGAGRILRSFDPEDREDRSSVSGADIIEFPGSLVIPGFIDSHNHQPTAARDFYEVKTAHVTELSGLRNVIAEAVKESPPGAWITTEHSLSLSQINMTEYPFATDFDDVSPNNPVAIRFGAHTMALNTLALQVAGFMSSVADPPHGLVERNTSTGSPAGPIYEYGAIALVLEHLDRRSQRDLVSAMREVQKAYAKEGITSLRITGLRDGDLRVYQELLRQDQCLNNRVFGGPRLDPTKPTDELVQTICSWPVVTGFANEWLGVDAVKIFVDAGVEALRNERTTLFVGHAKLLTLVSTAISLGWSVTCHAISANAIELTLDVFEDVSYKLNTNNKLAIEHGYLATDQSLTRAAKLGVWLSTQPAIGWIESKLLGTRLSNREIENFAPLATANRLGVQCTLGSDWNAIPGTSCRPFSPLQTVRLTTGYGQEDEHGFGKRQKVSVETALFMHTRASAQLVNASDLGGIWPGARADLAVLSGNFDHAVHEGNVIASVVDGRVVEGD